MSVFTVFTKYSTILWSVCACCFIIHDSLPWSLVVDMFEKRNWVYNFCCFSILVSLFFSILFFVLLFITFHLNNGIQRLYE